MLKGKTALITGSNRGIGNAMVEEFAIKGADIIAHARTKSDEFEQKLLRLSAEYGVVIKPIYFDITDYDSMKSNIRELIKSKTPINVLVNNAAMPHGGLFQMTAMSKIREVFETNFFAHLELTQFLLRYMLKQGNGSIINISSINGIDLKEGECAYGVSKAALIAFTKTLSQECGSKGVRVNAIAPGLTDTKMGSQMTEQWAERLIENSSMKRKANPCEIAKVAAFLASDESSFVNGQVIRVDGGS